MSKMSFSGQMVGGKNLRMAFKRSGVRFSYAPQNTLKISKLQRLYTISYTVFTSCVYFLLLSPTILKPPRKPVPRWTKVYHFRELSEKLPRHTSVRTQKNPAPHTKSRKFLHCWPEGSRFTLKNRIFVICNSNRQIQPLTSRQNTPCCNHIAR